MTKLPSSALAHASVVASTRRLQSFVRHRQYGQALHLFHHLHSCFVPLDPFILSLAIKSTTSLCHFPLALSLHSIATRLALLSSPHVSSSFINFYGKCVSLTSAHQLFDEITQRNPVVWNTIISLYSLSGHVGTAIQLFALMDVPPSASCFNSIINGLAHVGAPFGQSLSYARKMQSSGLKPNLITLLALLSASRNMAPLNSVKEIHGYAMRNSIHPNFLLSSSLVENYGRCGFLQASSKVFNEMPRRDVVAWSAMVSACAFNGDASGAVLAFQQMEEAGILPDGISCLGVLKACSHAGLVEEAKIWFGQMSSKYGISPGNDHFACMVDMLGRAGRLNEAHALIRQMPVEPGPKVWGALLSACRTHGNVGFAEIAARKLFEIEPDNAGNFVLLSSIYSKAGMPDEADKVVSPEDAVVFYKCVCSRTYIFGCLSWETLWELLDSSCTFINISV